MGADSYDGRAGLQAFGRAEMGEWLRGLGAVVALAAALGGLPCHSWVSALQSQVKPAKPPAAAIDINKATANDLQKLPGIGPSLAKQIVAYRSKHGPYRRVEDLMVIKGIGYKKWKEIRPYIRVGGR
jgi:comEA protein